MYPTVLSAADEEAVEAFLRDAIPFTRIPVLIEAALDAYRGTDAVTPESIEEADCWARDFVADRVSQV